MAEQTIVGVDFSGGDETRQANTWITEGQFESSQLRITGCPRPIKRKDLTELLLEYRSSDTVVAMDFPFSVPWDFAKYWKPNVNKMPELWYAASEMNFCNFDTRCNDYSDQMPKGRKHPLRIGDLYSSKPLSCLNERMKRMTFYGMQMLHQLWESKSGFRIPPLDDSGGKGPVLLEVMPGSALESFNLLYEPYKTVTKRTRKSQIDKNRMKILNGLENGSRVEITNLKDFMSTYLNHHDGIDSLVAAVVATQWKLNMSLFNRPENDPTDCSSPPKPSRRGRASKQALAMTQMEAAQLEGWIYTHKK